MSTLSPLDQLAVDAFAIALETCREEGTELPKDVWALEKELDQHISELKAIAQQHPQLNTAYRTARKLLRRDGGDRQKRLSFETDQLQTVTQFTGTPPQSFSAEPSLHHQQPQTQSQVPQPTPPPLTAPSIKRFVLPVDASDRDRNYFQTYIADLKRLNPNWVVTRDRCNPGESDAYVMIPNNENYQVAYAAYLGSQLINDFFAGFTV